MHDSFSFCVTTSEEARRSRLLPEMVTLTFLMLILIARLNAEKCSPKYYEITREEGSSLPPEEIISSHNVDHPVQIMCTFLCHKEEKCVGFNFRTRIADENCQLTNVTTQERETPKKGDWTLLALPQRRECFEYRWLNESDRNRKYSTSGPRICDAGLSTGWYRFGGGAGTKLSRTCVGVTRCGTTAPGWMYGALPTVAQGKVTRKVWYYYGNNCLWKSNDIEVVNCGYYYVYNLGPTPSCNLRYCGSDN